jgi:cytochrome c oxidase assembly protein subunit 15
VSTVPATAAPHAPTPWARRAAWLGALSSVPLILFGGSVTTLGAGMAVDGWLVAEGHFLLFFPAEKWFRDTATFVEHTHRLWGALVGVCVLACALLAWRARAPRGVRLMALVALLAVSAQGTLGGLRVLENSPELAFVHGALAQAVFALLCLNALCFSRAWSAAPRPARAAAPERRALASAAGVAVAATYAQVVLGAWYRHGLRPTPAGDAGLRFLLHGLGALLVLAALAALLRRAAALRAAEGGLAPALARVLGAVPVLVLVQLLLGGLAWAGFRPDAIGPAEWILSVAHVLGGALLLAALVLALAWARRLARAAELAAEPGLATRVEARRATP